METTTTPDYPRGITFEQVWAAIQADREAARASHEEFEKRMKEWDDRFEREKKERDDRFEREKKEREEHLAREKKEQEEHLVREKKERDNRTDQIETKFDKLFGYWGNRMGEMAEAVVSPNLMPKFKALGFNFNEISRNKHISVEGRCIAEFDAFLENDNEVIIVEIKGKPTIDEIKECIERMDKIRAYGKEKGDKRKYYGAIGGIAYADNVRDFVLKSGFYVIEPSGETFDIVVPEGKYKPREW